MIKTCDDVASIGVGMAKVGLRGWGGCCTQCYSSRFGLCRNGVSVWRRGVGVKGFSSCAKGLGYLSHSLTFSLIKH